MRFPSPEYPYRHRPLRHRIPFDPEFPHRNRTPSSPPYPSPPAAAFASKITHSPTAASAFEITIDFASDLAFETAFAVEVNSPTKSSPASAAAFACEITAAVEAVFVFEITSPALPPPSKPPSQSNPPPFSNSPPKSQPSSQSNFHAIEQARQRTIADEPPHPQARSISISRFGTTLPEFFVSGEGAATGPEKVFVCDGCFDRGILRNRWSSKSMDFEVDGLRGRWVSVAGVSMAKGLWGL